MEYVYAAILLHKAGKTVDEKGVKSVLDAAGDIDDAMAQSAIAVAPVAAAAPVEAAGADSAPAEEKKEESDEKEEASGMEGLGALFG